MAKIFIGVGHGGTDPGATGINGIEKDLNLKCALQIKAFLESCGHQVMMSRYSDETMTVYQRVTMCNEYDPDIAIDIHFNAGGGRGFEIYRSVQSPEGTIGFNTAVMIEQEVRSHGYPSRGVKTRATAGGNDYYAFISRTKCHALVIEGGFIDTREDDYIKSEKGLCDLAMFYASGINKVLGDGKPIDVNANQTDSMYAELKKLYKVQVGAFYVRKNAEELVRQLKLEGRDAFIVEE